MSKCRSSERKKKKHRVRPYKDKGSGVLVMGADPPSESDGERRLTDGNLLSMGYTRGSPP